MAADPISFEAEYIQGRIMTKFDRSFRKTQSLAQITRTQWESLCDGCGRCCVEKFENRKTGKVYFTSVACRFLDMQSCRCSAYHRRKKEAPWCLILTAELVPKIGWLPQTCAYRLVFEKKELYRWHPLISGSSETVHEAGISVRGKVISSQYVHPDDLENYIVDWKVWGRLGSDLKDKIANERKGAK